MQQRYRLMHLSTYKIYAILLHLRFHSMVGRQVKYIRLPTKSTLHINKIITKTHFIDCISLVVLNRLSSSLFIKDKTVLLPKALQ